MLSKALFCIHGKGSKSETRVSAILEIMEMRERDLHCGPTILTANSCGHRLSNRIEETTPGYGVPDAPWHPDRFHA